MKTSAIVNQKGGVGKTTTVFNMAYGLAERKKNVMLIDLDSNGSLSVCCGIENPDLRRYTISNLLLIKSEKNRKA